MTHRSLTVGMLTAMLTFEGETLRAVELPAEVPEGLDLATLNEMCAQLAAFPITSGGDASFTQKVWDRLREIPSGSALTYAEVAAEVASPRAIRAVGQACASNRLLLVVPCHRVVAKDGLGGFAMGLAWKSKLLELESEG